MSLINSHIVLGNAHIHYCTSAPGLNFKLFDLLHFYHIHLLTNLQVLAPLLFCDNSLNVE